MKAIPVFRMFDYARTLDFYVGWLGFKIDWEYQPQPGSPRYVQISHGELQVHLTEHHGDCCPGGKAFVQWPNLVDYHRALLAKPYSFNRPGLEESGWNSLVVEVTDPSGNRILFNQYPP